MIKCKNCGKPTKNKKYCSRECQKQYKFLHQKKKRSQLEKFIVNCLRRDFPWLMVDENNRTVLGNLELDLFLPQFNIGIEINGQMHYKFIPYFHGNQSNFRRQIIRDQQKKRKCSELGIFLIVIPNLKSFTIKYGQEIYEHLKLILNNKFQVIMENVYGLNSIKNFSLNN